MYEFKLYSANEAMQLEPKRPRFFLGGQRRVYLNFFGFFILPIKFSIVLIKFPMDPKVLNVFPKMLSIAPHFYHI
jgi:hypothetical protein